MLDISKNVCRLIDYLTLISFLIQCLSPIWPPKFGVLMVSQLSRLVIVGDDTGKCCLYFLKAKDFQVGVVSLHWIVSQNLKFFYSGYDCKYWNKAHSFFLAQSKFKLSWSIWVFRNWKMFSFWEKNRKFHRLRKIPSIVLHPLTIYKEINSLLDFHEDPLYQWPGENK